MSKVRWGRVLVAAVAVHVAIVALAHGFLILVGRQPEKGATMKGDSSV